MIRTILIAATLVLAATSVAGAQPVDPFGTKGKIIISADRLSPLFSYSRNRTDAGGGDSNTTSTTSFNLLWSGEPQDIYDIPHLGLDFVVAPNLTIGGSLFATLPISSSRDQTMNNTTVSRDTTKISAFGLGGRVGYIFAISSRVSFWPRGGLSYTWVGLNSPDNQGNAQKSSTSQLGLSLEPEFVFHLGPHVGLLLGPVLDLPLSGNQHDEFKAGPVTTSTDIDSSQTHLGVNLGVLGMF